MDANASEVACPVCREESISPESLHVHPTCGQRYHNTCFDTLFHKLLLRQRWTAPVCLYCKESIFPRNAEARFECVECHEEIPDLASPRVYVHPTCSKPYHSLCVDVRLKENAGQCADCDQPIVDRVSEWFPVELFGEGMDRYLHPGGWFRAPCICHQRRRFAAVVANYKRLRHSAIPYHILPVNSSLLQQFPKANLGAFSLMSPMVVEVEKLRAKGIPVNFIVEDEYRAMAEKAKYYKCMSPHHNLSEKCAANN